MKLTKTPIRVPDSFLLGMEKIDQYAIGLKSKTRLFLLSIGLFVIAYAVFSACNIQTLENFFWPSLEVIAGFILIRISLARTMASAQTKLKNKGSSVA